MKNFIEKFSDARSVGTPFINARTADPASTIANVGKMLGKELEETPMIVFMGSKGWERKTVRVARHWQAWRNSRASNWA
jgi:hypothetical protein